MTVPVLTLGTASAVVKVRGDGLVTIDVDPGAVTVTVVLVPLSCWTTR